MIPDSNLAVCLKDIYADRVAGFSLVHVLDMMVQ